MSLVGDAKVKHVWFARVLSVEEHFESAGARATGKLDSTGKPEYATVQGRSLGWFVRVTDSSAICLGPDQPPYVVGDRVKLTMEQA